MKFNQKAIKQLLSIAILSTVAIACTDQSDDLTVIGSTNEVSEVNKVSDMSKQPIPIEGTVWNLVSYNQQPILAKSEITAEFKQGRVNGSAGCNQYFADYKLDNAQLNINSIGSTKRACPDVDGLTEQETTYLRLLDKAQSATVVNNVLTIKTDDGDLVFEAKQPIPIEGTVWNLVSYNQQPILAKSEITAEFKQGRVNGSAGCNQYFADYKLDNAQLNVNSIGSTKRACPDVDGLTEQETTYLRLLDKAQSATVENNLLTIKTDDGDLVFEAKQPVSIEGTVWNLVSYNQQQTLPKSEITAEFKQGRVSGLAGCNQYFADYQLDNAQLNINSVGSTRKVCRDVAGLMEQETAYLRLLDKAQTATVENNQLTIKTDDGDLVFEAAKNSASDN